MSVALLFLVHDVLGLNPRQLKPHRTRDIPSMVSAEGPTESSVGCPRGLMPRSDSRATGQVVVGPPRQGGRHAVFTTDTHYGHQDIIRFSGRPYVDVHHMNVDLVNRASRMVEAGNEPWHLGDVALGHLDSSLTNLARIAVDVTLVAGNHDRCHPYHRTRSERFVDVYRERCRLRDLILTNTTLTLGNGVDVLVSRFPFSESDSAPRIGRNGKPIVDKFSPLAPSRRRVLAPVRARPRRLASARPDDQRRRRCLGRQPDQRARPH